MIKQSLSKIPAAPVQVRCTILDAWGWCTGTTQRDGMGREKGGGFRMGNTCTAVADAFGGSRKAVRDRFALQGGTGDFP